MSVDDRPPCYSRDGKPWCTPHDSPRRAGELCDFMVGFRRREADDSMAGHEARRYDRERMREYEAARAWEAAVALWQQAKENQ